MGTRGFLCFVADGTEKTAYNHWDSYPEALGVNVLDWLSGVIAAGDLDSARDSARSLRVVAPGSEPADEDIQRLAPYLNRSVGAPRDRPGWYQLLRETQGDPAAILDAGVIEDASGFPTDSLFAEWGYVVDFDRDVFEVYEGFVKKPHDKGRFAGRAPHPDSGQMGYYPVTLVASYPFAELPNSESFVGRLADRDE